MDSHSYIQYSIRSYQCHSSTIISCCGVWLNFFFFLIIEPHNYSRTVQQLHMFYITSTNTNYGFNSISFSFEYWRESFISYESIIVVRYGSRLNWYEPVGRLMQIVFQLHLFCSYCIEITAMYSVSSRWFLLTRFLQDHGTSSNNNMGFDWNHRWNI